MFRYTPQTESLNVPEYAETILLIPTTILNLIVILWVSLSISFQVELLFWLILTAMFVVVVYYFVAQIFWSLFGTVKYLQDNKQPAKLIMFKRLTLILVLVYISALIVFLVQL